MEKVHFAPLGTEESWWQRYENSLNELTPTARQVLQADCTYILERGIFREGSPNPSSWPENRTRTGLVMGSVQSGKTASMFGVTALALDRGVDIIVILAGTRLSLWRQTFERLTEQLDSGPDDVAKSKRRLLRPSLSSALAGSRGSLLDFYRLPSAQVRRKMAENSPIVIVAMKQTDHLNALGRVLRESVFDEVERLERPAHLLVLDDEADDGSVLDAAVEAGLDPLSSNLKQIPRSIADLWEPRSVAAPRNLFTTYVGYTATPQSNLLQEDHNPLAPRDFVVSLRTPLDIGHPAQPDVPDATRSSTYPEPAGMGNYYTGGEVFYNRGSSAGLCVDLTDQPEDDLAESLRSFLVAGAIRLHWALQSNNEIVGAASITSRSFATREEAAKVSAPAHSMLIHPAADIDAHFSAAEDVLLWAGVPTRTEARALIDSGNARLPKDLISKMRKEQNLWAAWLERFRSSSDSLAAEFNIMTPRSIPDWETVRDLLETEILPGTRVSVVNSDPSADDRPEYEPEQNVETGLWRAARDLSTVFVSGNVMARGLTLSGMTTALFRRSTDNPYADTQMQMQRWFGYRGAYLELCRVFASSQQLDLFSAYHDVDEALREGISAKMIGDAPSPLVLHGLGFLATGKIANLGRVPLCPSAKPFITLTNAGDSPDQNADLLAKLFSSEYSSNVIVSGVLRGRALDRSLSLGEAADLLGSLSFDSYEPGNKNFIGELWERVQARVHAVSPLPDGTQLYDAPSPANGTATDVRTDCPYMISAYLRLWEACLNRPVRGLFVTGVPFGRWAMSDLRAKEKTQPRFTVGIRYGDGGSVNVGPLADLEFSIQATRKSLNNDGELDTTWGTNRPNAAVGNFRGDEYFDYYHRGESLPTTAGVTPWRPQGADGQILFYVNQRKGQPYPTVSVGVCIPAGGPEQFAAVRAGALSMGSR